ncbi:MAG TPA: hypothetical protein VGF18_07555 [Candidatus Tumulicola sp.]
MSEQRRRRRSDDTRESNGLPLIPLVLVVIFAGLLLGGLLAHFFGGPGKQANNVAVARATPPLVTPVPAESMPSTTPTPAPSPRSSKSPKPSSSPSAGPSVSPAASPSRSPSPAASTTPKVSPSPHATAHATVRPSAVAVQTQSPAAAHPQAVATATPAVTAAPAAPSGSTRAESVVRSYLSAVASGNRALATTYLASGVPGEVFMDQTARVVSLKSSEAGSGYRVSADVVTSNGEYAVTFSVAPGASGLQITDHYAIKVR